MNATQALPYSTETQRQYEEKRSNEQRFFDYNARRIDAGLPVLKFSDFLARKHGLPAVLERARKAISPEYRGNVISFNR